MSAGDALAGFAEAPVEGESAGSSGAPADFPQNPARGCLRIYFHCALEGHKLDCIARNDRASFCVVGSDEVVPAEFTTYFRSAVAFGRVRLVEGHDERVRALRLLADKYAPGLDEGFAREVTTLLRRTRVLRLDVEALTGKEAIELVRGAGSGIARRVARPGAHRWQQIAGRSAGGAPAFRRKRALR